MGSADVAARVRLFFDAAWCLRDVHMPGSHARAPRAAAQRPRVAAEQTRGCAHQPRSAHFSNSRAFPSAVAAAHAAAMAPQAGDALLKAAEAADAQALVELHARHVRFSAFASERSGRRGADAWRCVCAGEPLGQLQLRRAGADAEQKAEAAAVRRAAGAGACAAAAVARRCVYLTRAAAAQANDAFRTLYATPAPAEDGSASIADQEVRVSPTRASKRCPATPLMPSLLTRISARPPPPPWRRCPP